MELQRVTKNELRKTNKLLKQAKAEIVTEKTPPPPAAIAVMPPQIEQSTSPEAVVKDTRNGPEAEPIQVPCLKCEKLIHLVVHLQENKVKVNNCENHLIAENDKMIQEMQLLKNTNIELTKRSEEALSRKAAEITAKPQKNQLKQQVTLETSESPSKKMRLSAIDAENKQLKNNASSKCVRKT